jgi:hypothetical protein
VEPLLASGGVSILATAPRGAGADNPAPSPSSASPGSRPGLTNAIVALGLSAGLLVVAFVSSGGVDQTSATAGNTWTEIALTALGGLALATAAWGAGRRRARAWGAGTVGLMAALAALTGLSIIWSVVPDTSWSAANQMLSYLSAFAGAAALARLAPARWPALLGAIALIAAALSAWALLAKVFPATLAPDNQVGRLQAPFGYWNALGVTAALGLPACLWAGARRDRGRRLAALSVPAITLLLSAVVLSASRSADAAAIIVVALWIVFVPLRLRSVAVLGAGAVGAAIISGWGLAHSQLTLDGALTPAMDAAGHSFGIVLVIVLALAAAAGVATAAAIDRTAIAPATRRRIGIALIALACLLPVGAIAGLSVSSRGLTGEISHAWTTLTSSSAKVSNTPGRVFQFGSSRPLYWHQGLDVGRHALFKGVGASGYGTARLRYTTLPYKSDQAHSYIIETFADLGLLGIAATLALLVSWCLAAARPLAPRIAWRSLPDGQVAERAGMIALAATVVGFGIQSALDWTWYFPGVSVPVLLCAGWLAGRGPLAQPVGFARVGRSLLDRPAAVAVGFVTVVIALAGVWVQWQPQRSADQLNASLNATADSEAFAQARAAASSDPLAYEPRLLLASLYQSVNNVGAQRAQLEQATRTQPDNPIVWSHLGGMEYDAGEPVRAIAALQRVMALDHTSDPFTRAAATTIQQARIELARARRKAGRARSRVR